MQLSHQGVPSVYVVSEGRKGVPGVRVVGRSHVTYHMGISLWTDRETGLKTLPHKKAFQYRMPTAHSPKCCKCYESHQMSAPSGSPQVNNCHWQGVLK